jgi:hypothetical protein
MFIVDLDILNLRELFEILHEWLGDGVQRPVRLTFASQINMCHPIRNDQFAVTRKTIEHQPQSLIPFNIPRTLEVFI